MEERDILGDDPSNTSQLLLNPSLLYIRELLLNLVREPETDNRKTFKVVLCVFLVEWRVTRCDQFRGGIDGVKSTGRFGFMDLGKYSEVTRVLESSRDHSGFGQVILHDSPVSVESEVEDCAISCVPE